LKRIIFLALSVVICGIALAQEPLPSGITPLNGSVTLRYAPKFESRCTIKKSEKKPGEFFGTKITESGFTEVFEESGRTKLAVKITLGQYFVRMIFGLEDDRTMAGMTYIDIQSNFEAFNKSKEKSGKFFLGLLKRMSGAAAYGRSLKQGTRFYTDAISSMFGKDAGEIGTTESAESAGNTGYDSVDKLFSEIQIQVKSDDFAVIGTANIRGRESLIFGGEIVVEVGKGDNRVSVTSKGWEAFDLQSGLKTGSSMLMVVGNAEKGVTTSTDDYECSITGTPTKAPQSRPSNAQDAKSAEQRLIELKALLDKGLIIPEQFESKHTEILKSL
jgi:hypothetical protein